MAPVVSASIIQLTTRACSTANIIKPASSTITDIYLMTPTLKSGYFYCMSELRSQFFLSVPWTGTTWMQEMVTLISSRGDSGLSQTVPNWARAPWLEQHYFAEVLKTSSITPRVITTHLPYHLLGRALLDSKVTHTDILSAGDEIHRLITDIRKIFDV